MMRPRALCRGAGGGQNDVFLPLGERPDGSIVRIGEVERGLACDCRCPGFGGRLVAHNGARKEHHFQHHARAACSGAYESALHKLAKQILDRELFLVVPPVTFGDGEDEVVESKGGRFAFDRAELEIPFPGFQPDVILYRGQRRLLVEVMVTHAAGPEKQARIAASDIAAVEIDLGALHRQADDATVTSALCETAPRWWLHNARLDKARATWEANAAEKVRRAAEAAERQARQAQARIDRDVARIRRALAGPAPQPGVNPHRQALDAAGLWHQVDLPVDGEGCFAVPRAHWQAAALAALVLAPMKDYPFSDRQEGIHPAALIIDGALGPMVRLGIPAFVKEEALAAITQQIGDFVPPYQALQAYLALLARAGVLSVRKKRLFVTQSLWTSVEHTRETTARRKEQKAAIRELAERLVATLPAQEKAGFSMVQWFGRPLPGFGMPPGSLLDDEADDLIGALKAIATMLAGSGAVTEQSLGLPLGPAMTRERRRRQDKAREAAVAREALAAATREQDRLEALAQANTREAQLHAAALPALGLGTQAWLDMVYPAFGDGTPRAAARRGESGLWQALEALRKTLEQLERTRKTSALREKLVAIASTNAKPDHARAFLNSAQPRLRGCKPIDYCTDDRSFETVVRMMDEVTRTY